MTALHSLWQDLRYGARSLRATPAATALVLVLIVLGAGLNTAVFSFVNAALVQSLAYRDFDRLVLVSEFHAQRSSMSTLRPANYFDWKAENRVFESVTAAVEITMELGSVDQSELVKVKIGPEEYFSVLGVPALIGRTFEAQDYETVVGDPTQRFAVSDVVVLSYPFWQRQFAGDPGAIGKTLTLNGNAITVVGVMPPAFQGLGGKLALWLPWVLPPEERHNRQSHYSYGYARLKEGVSLEQAQAEMSAIYRRLEERYPAENRGWTVRLQPWRDVILGDTKLGLVLLLAGALVVLAIAGVNVAGLLLARGAAREQETRIRRALGASRGRIFRQFLTESLLLGAVGGALSISTAWMTIRLLSRFELPTRVPFVFTAELDSTVLLFTVLISVLTGILFGLVPAMRASKLELRPTATHFDRGRTGSMLIVSEIALAVVLLSAGGLLVRSFVDLYRVDLGFDPKNLLIVEVVQPRAQTGTRERSRHFQQRMLEELEALAGVQAAATSNDVPLRGIRTNLRFAIEGGASTTSDDFNAPTVIASHSYLPTIGATLLKGRYFGEGEKVASPRSAIISQTMAREYWPNEEAVGKRLTFLYPDPELNETWFTIIGVVRDVTYERLAPTTKRTLYLSAAQVPFGEKMLIMRTVGDPLGMVEAVKERIRAVDPTRVVSEVVTMEEISHESLREPRLRTSLLALFAMLAVILAGSGLYGLLAFSVSRRTQEIGVRMALGAGRVRITRLVSGDGLVLALIGIGIGLAAALGIARFLSSFLYGISQWDPVTFAATSFLVLAVALLASYIPARRAAKIEPTVALRHQ